MDTGIIVRAAIPRLNDGVLEWLMVERLSSETYFPNFLEFPGGAVKRINGKLESLDEALIRELQEEINTIPTNPRLIDKNIGEREDGTESDNWQLLLGSDCLSGEPEANTTQIEAIHWVPHEAMRNARLTRLTEHWFFTLPYFRKQTGLLTS